MGLKISMACQQQRVTSILGPTLGNHGDHYTDCYVDDILLAAERKGDRSALADHVDQCEEVMARLVGEKAYLNVRKLNS